MPAWHWEGADLILLVRVQTRAGRDRVVGERHGRLQVQIGAAPVDGRANARLCALLARELGVASSRVTVVGGDRSRDKRLAIIGPRATPKWLSQCGVSP